MSDTDAQVPLPDLNAADAPNGPGMALGKLRYQACNHNSCLPPKTIEVKLPVVVQ